MQNKTVHCKEKLINFKTTVQSPTHYNHQPKYIRAKTQLISSNSCRDSTSSVSIFFHTDVTQYHLSTQPLNREEVDQLP